MDIYNTVSNMYRHVSTCVKENALHRTRFYRTSRGLYLNITEWITVSFCLKRKRKKRKEGRVCRFRVAINRTEKNLHRRTGLGPGPGLKGLQRFHTKVETRRLELSQDGLGNDGAFGAKD